MQSTKKAVRLNIALIKLAICANKWPLAAIVRKNKADAHQTAIMNKKPPWARLKASKELPTSLSSFYPARLFPESEEINQNPLIPGNIS